MSHPHGDFQVPQLSVLVSCFLSDLLRRQEELRRMEELHSQEMQKRKEMQLRYLCPYEFLDVEWGRF